MESKSKRIKHSHLSEKSPPNPFLWLPNVLIIHTFGFIPRIYYGNIALVCTNWHKQIRASRQRSKIYLPAFTRADYASDKDSICDPTSMLMVRRLKPRAIIAGEFYSVVPCSLSDARVIARTSFDGLRSLSLGVSHSLELNSFNECNFHECANHSYMDMCFGECLMSCVGNNSSLSTSLQRLCLNHTVYSKCIKNLSHLKKLDVLSVDTVEFGADDSVADSFGDMKLCSLSIASIKSRSDAHSILKVPPSFSCLTSLTMGGREVHFETSSISEMVSCCSNLEKLHIQCASLDRESVSTIIELLPNLRLLGIPSSKVDDELMTKLVTLPKLTSLNLNSCEGITHVGVMALSKLTSLRTLRLGWVHMNCETSESPLLKIAQNCSQIRVLTCTGIRGHCITKDPVTHNIRLSDVVGNFVEQLSTINLQSISLAHCAPHSISHGFIVLCQKCVHLKTLDISGDVVESFHILTRGLVRLSQLHYFRRLFMNFTILNDESMGGVLCALRYLNHLDVLSLNHCAIEVIGGWHIGNCTSLRKLFIDENKADVYGLLPIPLYNFCVSFPSNEDFIKLLLCEFEDAEFTRINRLCESEDIFSEIVYEVLESDPQFQMPSQFYDDMKRKELASYPPKLSENCVNDIAPHMEKIDSPDYSALPPLNLINIRYNVILTPDTNPDYVSVLSHDVAVRNTKDFIAKKLANFGGTHFRHPPESVKAKALHDLERCRRPPGCHNLSYISSLHYS